MGVYKVRNPDGSISYTGTRPTAGSYEEWGARGSGRRRDAELDNRELKSLIGEVRKRVPRIPDYLEYIAYLRHHHPWHFDRVMADLKLQDPEAWAKLQRYPQFRPLRETAIGWRAAERHLAAGVGFASGKFTGTVERWLETTVKDMMKRDRFGPYSDALEPGARPPVPGTGRTPDNPQPTAAAVTSQRNLRAARAAVRSSKATAVTRLGGPLLDLGIGALDPQVFSGVAVFEGIRLGKELEEQGILMPEEASRLPRMMARREFAEVRELIEAGRRRAEASP